MLFVRSSSCKHCYFSRKSRRRKRPGDENDEFAPSFALKSKKLSRIGKALVTSVLLADATFLCSAGGITPNDAADRTTSKQR